MSVPAVFLDRDGVLNDSIVRDGVPHPPANLDEVRHCPGVFDACDAFHGAGLVLVMVTNQPDIARGKTSRAAVDALNAAVCEPLGITHVRVCPHDDDDGCGCRKPKPGLLLGAAAELGLDLSASVMVGDRWRDIDAGAAAGTATVHVRRSGYDEREPRSPDLVVQELLDAVPFIVDWSTTRRAAR